MNCDVAPPCFYSSPEQTNQTRALESGFRLLMLKQQLEFGAAVWETEEKEELVVSGGAA